MTVVSAVTAWSGLAIQKIEISGQSETSEVDIIHALGIGPFPSLVTFDAGAGRDGIAALPWVKQATIKKLYPDTLQVSVVERQPFAIWQHDDKIALVDREGATITSDIGEDYADAAFRGGRGGRASAPANMRRWLPACRASRPHPRRRPGRGPALEHRPRQRRGASSPRTGSRRGAGRGRGARRREGAPVARYRGGRPQACRQAGRPPHRRRGGRNARHSSTSARSF